MPVNNAPSGADLSLTFGPPTTVVFTVADFGFSDPDGDSLLGVKITSPISGLNIAIPQGTRAVAAGEVVSAADIAAGDLTYRTTNIHGVATVSLGFEVVDTGGTANGGVNTDPTPNTISISQVAYNSEPAGTTWTTPHIAYEDTPYVIQAGEFGFSDTNNHLLAVKFTTLPSLGTLSDNGVALTPGQFVSAADISAGKLVYLAAPNASGADYTSFTFQVQDDGGTANGGIDLDQTPNLYRISVTPVNDAPSGISATYSLSVGGHRVLSIADFGYSDPDGDPMSGVKIVSAPGSMLTDNGVAVHDGQVVAATDIASGGLVFTPPGTGTIGIGFQVIDNGNIAFGGANTDPTTRTLTMVATATTPANHAPTGSDETLALPKDGMVTLHAGDFGFSDSDGDAFAAVKIDTLPGAGTLTLGGAAVAAGQTVSTTDLAANKLVFTPVAGATGDNYAQLTFQVQDAGGTANGGVDLDPSANTLTFSVTTGNHAPEGADSAFTMGLASTHVFTAADFGFSDVDGDHLSGVKIVNPVAGGGLRYNGVTALNEVTTNTTISAADIAAGKLVYVPVSGNGPHSFSFEVVDDGGTANGGVNTDATPNIITITTVAPHITPSGLDGSASLVAGGAKVFAISDFGYSDSISNSGPDQNAFAGVKIDSLPGAGVLADGGVAVTAGETISAAHVIGGLLTYTASASAGPAFFSFQVQDNGGTAYGSIDLDPTPNIYTLNVSAPSTVVGGPSGSSGNDVVTWSSNSAIGSSGNDLIVANGSGDSINGGAGDDSITGGAGSNYLRGDDGNDVIVGGAGFDDINGNKGDDTITGGPGGDWLVGGQGNDLIASTGGDDILLGNLGNDTLHGGSGNEIIRGGQADDVLTGGDGNDWLSGDRGSDTLTGGAGADIFHSFSGAGVDLVTDFSVSDGDRVQLDPGTSYTVSQVGANVVIDMGGGDQMTLEHVQLSSLPSGWIFIA